MNEFKNVISWIDIEEIEALSTAIPSKNNMVINIPTLHTKKLEIGLENCRVGLEFISTFSYDSDEDRDLILASKGLASRLPLPRYTDTLKIMIPQPVGMTTTYNEHIDKLIATGPAIVRARNAILELDATLAKAISEKDYRTAAVRLDGDAKVRLKEVTSITKELIIDMKGEESVSEVISLFTDINSIPDLVSKFTSHKFVVDIDELSVMSDTLTDRAKKFNDLVDYQEISSDMLASVSNIVTSTANIISMVAAVLGNVRNTKKALTKAIELIK